MVDTVGMGIAINNVIDVPVNARIGALREGGTYFIYQFFA